MNLNINIPFESEKGNQYALVFSVYEPLSDISIPVVEVSLALKKQVTSTNSLKVFNYIIKEIEEYLSKREVILYYYCDNAEIYYRNSKKRFLSPQHFRSELFYTLFIKADPKDLLIKTSEIINETVGNHYINFIYKPKHQHDMDILSKEIEEYQK